MINCVGDPAYRHVLDEMRERMWQHIADLGDPIARSFDVLARRRGQ